MGNVPRRRRPICNDRSDSHFGTSAMDATAFFGDVSGCCDGVKMKRQKEHRQEQQQAD